MTGWKYTVIDLAMEINQPQLPSLVWLFLYDQLYSNSHLTSAHVSLNACPTFSGMIYVCFSAAATYYAPSNPSGIGGMHCEHIWAAPSWWQGPACYDCAFINSRPELEGMCSLDIVCVLLFFHSCSMMWLILVPVRATPSNIPKWASCRLYKNSGSSEMRLMGW